MRTHIILLVDNDQSWLDIMEARLLAARHDVLKVSTREDAVALLSDPERRKRVDLAIIDLHLCDDLNLDDLSGLDVVLRHARGIPKILVTRDQTLLAATLRGLREPDVPYVFKQEPYQLMREVRRAIVPRVFIAHGHDRAAREAVRGFLHEVGLTPVVLQEQVDVGVSILEKLRRHGDGADFAVVLLTGDDRGAPRATPGASRPRGRQNVIFELGYFIAKLGAERVAVLREPDATDDEGLEIPSNFLGIDTILLDDRGTWKGDLHRAIKQADIELELYQRRR